MVKKVFTYIFNKPLYYKYYKSLEPSTRIEQKLIEDLKKTFKDLPHQDTTNCVPSEKIWKQNMNKLRQSVLTDNLREFLRWDVILGTMFVGNQNYVVAELNHLKEKPDWNERWRKAIEEVATGFPIPFNKYPRSSGNLIHHAYHMSQFEEKTGLHADKIEFVCEFGGGYGSMCRLLYNLGFKGKYVILAKSAFPNLSIMSEVLQGNV